MRRPALRRAPQPSADYLDEVLAALWPPPARVARARRRGPAVPGATELVVLPNARRPKLVAPRRPLAATAAAVRNSRSVSSPLTAVALRGIALAARLGAADLLPDRVVVSGGAGSDLVAHLTGRLGRPVLISLQVGPVRATQKPVLQVLTPGGRTVGFAKVGLTPLARSLVAREGEVLADLGGRDLRAVRAPRILHRGGWHGFEVLVQEAFPQHRGRPVDQGRLTAAMVEVARSHGVRAVPLADSAFWRRLRDRLLAVPDRPGVADALADAVRRTEAARGREPVPMGCWHGDWAPWNMTTDGDDVLVWDWETFAGDVPVGFDRVHYSLQSAVVLDNVHPREAVPRAVGHAGAELAAFDLPAAAGRLVVLLYLLHLVAGFLASGEDSSRLARLDSWVPAALPALTDQVVREAAGRPAPSAAEAERAG